MNTIKSELLGEKQKAAALQELARILESEFFRGSQRCSLFPEYSVRQVLEGKSSDELKERVIGAEVFHKVPDYDTSQDNIVRVTAAEVRKRLAQYYEDGRHNGGNPTIHLPLGSYAVHFRWAEDKAPSPNLLLGTDKAATSPAASARIAPAHGSRFGWRMVALCLLVVAALSAAIAYRNLRAADVVRNVWSPVLENPNPAVICISQPLAYRPSSGELLLQGPGDRMVPLQDAFVGIGDAHALADVARLLTARGKDWELLPANSTTSQTLMNRPIIVIGATSNKWTFDLMENLRFSFGPHSAIYDHSKPGVSWSVSVPPDWKVSEDYAVVSRFTSPRTGRPVIMIAGVTNAGTQAAAQFLTSPSLLSKALQQAPKNWKYGNLQFVLHTKLIGDSPEPPTVVAAHYW
jgi:hypothetical protein